MDDDLTDVDSDLVPVLGAGVWPIYPVGATSHHHLARVRAPDQEVNNQQYQTRAYSGKQWAAVTRMTGSQLSSTAEHP